MDRLRNWLARSETFRALASASAVLFARVGGTVATLAYTVIFVRLLSPVQFGAVSSIWSLAQLMVPLATLNLAPVAIRAVVSARQSGDDALAAGFILFTRRVILFMTPVAIAVFLLLIWLRFPEQLAAAPVGVGLVALSILLMAFVQTGAAIGVALDRAAASQIPRELVRPVLLLIVLAACAAFGWPLSISAALAIYAATVAVNLAVQRRLLREAMEFVRAQAPRIENARHWIATGFLLLPSRVINERAKIVMIVAASVVLPLDDVALITVALSLSGLLGFAITSVEIAFSAKLSRALHAHQTRRATRFLAIAGLAKLVLSAVMIVAILLLLNPILAIFGKHYVSADDITLILMGIPLVKAFFGKADLVLLVHDLRSRIFWLNLLTLALLFVAPVAAQLLPQADALRMSSFGFLLAFFTGYAGLWWIARRRTGIDTSAPGAIINWLRDH